MAEIDPKKDQMNFPTKTTHTKKKEIKEGFK